VPEIVPVDLFIVKPGGSGGETVKLSTVPVTLAESGVIATLVQNAAGFAEYEKPDGAFRTLTTCSAIVSMLESVPSHALILTAYEPESVYVGEYLHTGPISESFTLPAETNEKEISSPLLSLHESVQLKETCEPSKTDMLMALCDQVGGVLMIVERIREDGADCPLEFVATT
jgi:hypothetical protein